MRSQKGDPLFSKKVVDLYHALLPATGCNPRRRLWLGLAVPAAERLATGCHARSVRKRALPHAWRVARGRNVQEGGPATISPRTTHDGDDDLVLYGHGMLGRALLEHGQDARGVESRRAVKWVSWAPSLMSRENLLAISGRVAEALRRSMRGARKHPRRSWSACQERQSCERGKPPNPRLVASVRARGRKMNRSRVVPFDQRRELGGDRLPTPLPQLPDGCVAR